MEEVVPTGRWIDKRCRRVVIVVATNFTPKTTTVSYRYVQGVNGSGLWKRGVTPTQTISLADWNRRFKPEVEK